jgi:hypothetical protein
MGPEIPCQFNQKRGLTICAKWNTAQNQGGANHAADRCALAGESGILTVDTRRAWTKLSPRAPVGGEVFLFTSPLIERANRKLAQSHNSVVGQFESGVFP